MDDIFAILNVVNPDDRLQGILEALPEKWDSIRKDAIARQKEDPDFFFDEDGEKEGAVLHGEPTGLSGVGVGRLVRGASADGNMQFGLGEAFPA